MLSHTIACWLQSVSPLMHRQTKTKTKTRNYQNPTNISVEYIPIRIGGPDNGQLQPGFLGNPNR